jgi:hypothetical protein
MTSGEENSGISGVMYCPLANVGALMISPLDTHLLRASSGCTASAEGPSTLIKINIGAIILQLWLRYSHENVAAYFAANPP